MKEANTAADYIIKRGQVPDRTDLKVSNSDRPKGQALCEKKSENYVVHLCFAVTSYDGCSKKLLRCGGLWMCELKWDYILKQFLETKLTMSLNIFYPNVA